jgi:hypothetical protein
LLVSSMHETPTWWFNAKNVRCGAWSTQSAS